MWRIKKNYETSVLVFFEDKNFKKNFEVGWLMAVTVSLPSYEQRLEQKSCQLEKLFASHHH